MSKVTSMLQVTIPKALAMSYGIEPGDDIDWVEAGDSIRAVPRASGEGGGDVDSRLRLFDQATERLAARDASGTRLRTKTSAGRRGTREELYERARTD